MKKFLLAILLIFLATTAHSQNICEIIDGASLIANNGVFLGRITNRYSSESIFNEYGNYGSKYGSESIWNKYGEYGSKYSNYSPFNPYATEPPAIVKNGEIIGYLSINKYLQHTLNPWILKTCDF